MTCDSAGKIDRFVDLRDIQPTLAVHELVKGQDYYLAVMLVGAYQETLGDLHNLFGDTHVAHLRLKEEGAWEVSEVVDGDSAAEVLSYLQYDVDVLIGQIERACREAVAAGSMSETESRDLLEYYVQELHGYTYLEPESPAPEGA
jgi:arginine decarboxylase